MERMNFVSYGMNSLFWLKKVPLKPQILNAAIHHWDPDLHVFRFGLQELCPTVEEFHALLGCKSREQVVVPRQLISPSKTLKDLLGLRLKDAGDLVKGGELKVLDIIDKFQANGNKDDKVYQRKRQIAISICLLARFLLVSADGKFSPKLVDVAAQVVEGKDFVPMVLAETLLGLDKVHSKASMSFAGSPLLLQMWLFDKVNLLEKVVIPKGREYYYAKFYARNYDSRLIKHHDTVEGWKQWFSTLMANDINWLCSRSVVPDMAIKNMNFKRMAIVGLTSFTFYIPCRFLRQLGNDQGLPPVELEPSFNPSLKSVSHYKKSWPSRQKLAKKEAFNSGLEERYVEWLEEEIKEKAEKEGTDTLKRKRT